MTLKNRIALVLSLCLLLFVSISCQRTNKAQQNPPVDIANDTDASLSTSNNNNSDIDEWLVPLISEYLKDDSSVTPPPPPPPYTPLLDVALNERLTIPLLAYGNQTLNITATNGYVATEIQRTGTELTFDIQLDDAVALTDDSDEVEIVVRLNDGTVVGSQRYKITAIYATPEVVVSIEGLTLAQFNNAIVGTNYTVTSFNNLNDTALVNIGNEPSQEALTNLYNIINAVLPPQSTNLQTQSLVSQIRVLSGPNYAYKPDGRGARWLDPACHIRDDLSTYAQSNNWDPVNNLAVTTNAIAAHNAGFYGDDIVVVLLDSGIDAADEFDCPNTPQKEQHGTHVKNIIQAIAPNVTIVSKKIFNASGTATLDNLINTFDLLLAVKEIEQDYLLQGKKVILNMSFSAPVHSTQGHDMQVWSMLQELYDFYGDQILVVASSGNHGLDDDYRNEVFYPSGYARSFNTTVATGTFTFPPIPNVISIASAGLQSNQIQPVGYNPDHTAIDYLAYGMNLCANDLNATTCTGDYLVGSSYSTPVVSAIAALNWDQCDQNTSADIKTILTAQSATVNGVSQPLIQFDELIDCSGNEIFGAGLFWSRLFGSPTDDFGNAIATDNNGNIYGTGYTYGIVSGNIDYGSADLYIAKYDSNGNQVWIKQFGTFGGEVIKSIAIDENSESIYITGHSSGAFLGNIVSGNADVLIAKYDNNGNQIWVKQFGTSNSDWGDSITVDNIGNVYISGSIGGLNNLHDAFVSKYDSSGNQIWLNQLGPNGGASARAITADSSNNLIVTGRIWNTLTSTGDILITKYDGNGSQIWVKQITPSDGSASGQSVAIDTSGNIYIAGYIDGTLPSNTSFGLLDVFLSKYDSNGNQLWVKQFGTNGWDYFSSIDLDGNGNILVIGDTSGVFGGNINRGYQDILIAKHDNNGNQIWVKQFGTILVDKGNSIIVDNFGDIFITGTINKTSCDCIDNSGVFIAKVAP